LSETNITLQYYEDNWYSTTCVAYISHFVDVNFDEFFDRSVCWFNGLEAADNTQYFTIAKLFRQIYNF